jgi:hypothetical protein
MKESIRASSDAPADELEIGWRSFYGLRSRQTRGVQTIDRIHERSV